MSNDFTHLLLLAALKNKLLMKVIFYSECVRGLFGVGFYWTGFQEVCEMKAIGRPGKKCGKMVGMTTA